MTSSSAVRTRIAPSPTGTLHVGTARTALFNELFAHQQGGQFIVRIEDTDPARSKPAFERNILEGIAWLGLTWDEGPDKGGPYGPYRQSERRELYRAALEELVKSGRAYQEEGSTAIRFRVTATTVTFTDVIRGEVAVHPDTWGGDFIIARSLDDPLYHLAVVVDDTAQAISHVIRGEEHLTNTARHILLQEALGYERVTYAHLPLLLDAQRRKLSKRMGDVSLLAYRDKGYLPDAVRNYLAFLGWNPKDDQELLSHEDLQSRFNLSHVQKGGAIFSEDKLQSINKQYLRQLQPQQLLQVATPFLTAAGIDVNSTQYWQAALATEQERVSTLAELAEAIAFFKPDWQPTYPKEQLIWRTSSEEKTAEYLTALIGLVESISVQDFTLEHLTQTLMAWIDGRGLGRGDVLWPMRVALTGRDKSPSQFEVAAVLGKEATLARLRQALQLLQKEGDH